MFYHFLHSNTLKASDFILQIRYFMSDFPALFTEADSLHCLLLYDLSHGYGCLSVSQSDINGKPE